MKNTATDPSMNVALNGIHVNEKTLAERLGVEPGTRVPWAVAFPTVGDHLKEGPC